MQKKYLKEKSLNFKADGVKKGLPFPKRNPQHSEIKKKLFSWHTVVSPSYYLRRSSPDQRISHNNISLKTNKNKQQIRTTTNKNLPR